jgi:NADPH:quinone reductase
VTDTYKSVIVEGKGGLERITVRDLPLTPPKAGEARIKVRAAGAGSTDVMMRTAYYPYRPPFPFAPGYEVVGDVDAVGEGVSDLKVGQRVCALVIGGQAEYLVREAEHFVPVPDGLDDAEVVALILNYATAYQMIHRVAKMERGQSGMISGANGGVGTAAIELMREAGVRALGAASKAHFDLVRALGGEPIESRGKPLDEEVHAVISEGVDAAFDNLGGSRTVEHVRATNTGGITVGFGFMAAKGFMGSAVGFASLYAGTLLRGRRGTFYGITARYRKDPKPFREDMPKLFELLAQKKIRPKIAAKLPLLEGRKAQEMLEKGGIVGKIVLLA